MVKNGTVPQNSETQRIDKWLWYARFIKSRTQASKLCQAGKIRVNRVRVRKPSAAIKTGDVLTFRMEKQIRVVRVLAPGHRRGPAIEAQSLYEDLETGAKPEPRPESKPVERQPAVRTPGSGRPTKADRRALDKLRGKA